MQNQGHPCLARYTLGSAIRSLGFAIRCLRIGIRSKFQEKIPLFLCKGSPHSMKCWRILKPSLGYCPNRCNLITGSPSG